MSFLLKSELFFRKEKDMSADSYEIYSKIRDKLGYKDSEVAAGSGVTKSTFSDWKAGRYKPKDEKLRKIAYFLGISLEYLKTGKEKEGGESYYLNEETKEIAQYIFENKQLRMLFDVARNAPADRLKAYYNMISALENKENGNDEME